MEKKVVSFIIYFVAAITVPVLGQHTVAREWNEVLLDGIRGDFARPTVHARNLFHVSAAMYDAWAAYDNVATPWLLGKWNGSYYNSFEGVPVPTNLEEARMEAISYAAYKLIMHRFQYSPGSIETLGEARQLMIDLGYDPDFDDTNYASGNPASLGCYIAASMIEFGFTDGSNEEDFYKNQYYTTINPALMMSDPGNPDILDPNRWQPLYLETFIDQSGNVVPSGAANFLSPEWGNVVPFSLTNKDLTVYERNGYEYKVYHDPGPPPTLESNGDSDEYKFGFTLVARWSGHLDQNDGVMLDISPASLGNLEDSQYPTSFDQYPEFYDFDNGGVHSSGRALNPKTGLPYTPQIVARGDYTRVLAEFWADGPSSETPPGHWFTILNTVMDDPLLVRKFKGEGEVLSMLEWDVKAYFILGGAMHDVAITSWGIKGWYDYIRPVSAIRYMADQGQSSDENLPNYSPLGLALQEGFIELVEAGDPLAGAAGEHVDKIKIFTWRGPDYINDPSVDQAGTGWILAENWWPYQRPTFVTPPFAGYVSGHSTYSRAAAEVLSMFTGDPYFPGGLGVFSAPKNLFLVFEEGPSEDLELQWATYRDAADQCSLSRIWGGIHPPCDDIPGRIIGKEVGTEAFEYGEQYFQGIITDVESLDERYALKAYPNPASGVVNLSIPDQIGNYTVELFDMNGAKILEETGTDPHLKFSIQNLSAGLYQVHLFSKEVSLFTRLIVQ